MAGELLPFGTSAGTTPDSILSFTIEESTGANPKKVTLTDHDAPMGSPRKGEMFTLGGENERQVIRLDGRPTPIIHTRYTKWEPTVLRGHLRDHFSGIDGHGADIVSDLQQILDNKRECKLTCGPYTWKAFPAQFRLPVEGLNDFTYELRFDVLERPGYTPPPKNDSQILPFPTDLAAEVQSELIQQRVALITAQIAVDMQVSIGSLFDALDFALNDVTVAALAFENAPTKAEAEARTLKAQAQQVKDRCDDLTAALSSYTPEDVLTSTDEGDVATWQAEQFATLALLDICQTNMRSLQYTANQRIRTTTKLYKVAPGDTLGSIAASQLGSAARAYDLGLRPQDVVPGKTIRIPA